MKNSKFKQLVLIWLLAGLMLVPAYADKSEKAHDSLTDGPHVFYLNNETIVCSIVNNRANIKHYAAAKALKLTLPGVRGLAVSVDPKLVRPEKEKFSNVKKVFALSDVHGQFFRMKEILTGNRIMDQDYNWTFGKGHLVMVGDVFDRGPMVTECLWLLVHLEQQAQKAGGRVHMLLGNHDQMVLRADLRYVHKRYKKISKKLKRIRYPDLFGPDSFLGMWLRSKNAAIKINDTLFVHAGLHPWLTKNRMSLTEINRLVRRHMDSRSYVHAFNPRVSFVFGRNGVFWCRGYFHMKGYDPISAKQLRRVLGFYDALRVVVGHTRFDRIRYRVSGLVVTTAVNTEDDQPAQGLLIKNRRLFRADHRGHLTELD